MVSVYKTNFTLINPMSELIRRHFTQVSVGVPSTYPGKTMQCYIHANIYLGKLKGLRLAGFHNWYHFEFNDVELLPTLTLTPFGNECPYDTGNECPYDTGYECPYDTGNECPYDTGCECPYDTGNSAPMMILGMS